MKHQVALALGMGLVVVARAIPADAAEYYVAPDGSDSAAGSESAPFATLSKANGAAAAGDTIWVRGGTYYLTGQLTLSKSGTSDAKRTKIWAYAGEKPVLDASRYVTSNTAVDVPVVLVTGSYMHLRGLEVANAKVGASGDHSYSLVRTKNASNNTFELLHLHHGFGTGLFIDTGTGGNLILNCDSHDNYDEDGSQGDGQNGDGFGVHYQTTGPSTVIRGCRAWMDSDDGYDLISQEVPVTIENSYAFSNGYGSGGNGNGFKVGSSKNGIRHLVRNNVAWKNKAAGFYANHSAGGNTWYNNTSYANGTQYNMLASSFDASGNVTGTIVLTGDKVHIMRNNVGFPNKNSNMDGVDTASNTWDVGIAEASSDFASTDPTGCDGPRQADGSLPAACTFLQLAAGSRLIDKGKDVGLPFVGAAPDLGAYEYGASTGSGGVTGTGGSTGATGGRGGNVGTGGRDGAGGTSAAGGAGGGGRNDGGPAGSGGVVSNGGASVVGGSRGTAGTLGATGGATVVGTGGRTGAGGAAPGGNVANGGAVGSGGLSAGSGGTRATGSGGTTAASGSGGSSSLAGASGSGGQGGATTTADAGAAGCACAVGARADSRPGVWLLLVATGLLSRLRRGSHSSALVRAKRGRPARQSDDRFGPAGTPRGPDENMPTNVRSLVFSPLAWTAAGICAIGLALTTTACGENQAGGSGADAAVGGSGSGGRGGPGTGGSAGDNSGAGGRIVASGGVGGTTVVVSVGGSGGGGGASTGGPGGSAGQLASGGGPGTGGLSGKGGAAASGGSASTGGRATGGAPNGGATGSGGTVATGGSKTTGGNTGAGGVTGGGGTSVTGGAVAAGGSAGGTGGSTGKLIRNDTFWKDTSGTFIYSQGGGVLQVGDTYYWYGVKYNGAVTYAANPTSKNSDTSFVGVTIYSSKDLATWKLENTVKFSNAGGWFGRLGVVYNANTKKYVMVAQGAGGLFFAKSDTPTGDFVFDNVQITLPDIVNGNTGDQTLFQDDDGKAYLICSNVEGRSNLYVVPLRESDFLAIGTPTRIFRGAGREGNALFKYDGHYYFCSSDLHGWNSSHTYCLAATNILGPYGAEFVMTNTDADFSHVTQTGFFITVKGTQGSFVIFAGDRWSDFAGNGIGYNQWMPLSFDGTNPVFHSLSEWTLDAQAGTWAVGAKNNWALNPSFEADRVSVTQPAGWTTTNSSNVSGGHTGRWSWQLANAASLEQQATGLPSGTYTLSVWVKGSGATGAKLYAKGFGGSDVSASLANAGGTWANVSLPGITVSNGKGQFGVSTTAGSVTVDDFVLVRD